MACYRSGGCGPYENRSCSECPASKPEYANKNKMSIWDELADLKRRIPKDAKIYHVSIRYDNIITRHRVYITLDEWSDYNLGLIDIPICRTTYGFYSTKEKAIEAVKEATKNYHYPVEIIVREE